MVATGDEAVRLSQLQTLHDAGLPAYQGSGLPSGMQADADAVRLSSGLYIASVSASASNIVLNGDFDICSFTLDEDIGLSSIKAVGIMPIMFADAQYSVVLYALRSGTNVLTLRTNVGSGSITLESITFAATTLINTDG